MHHVRMHRATRLSTCALVPQPSNARGEPGTRLKKNWTRQLSVVQERCSGRGWGGGEERDRGGGNQIPRQRPAVGGGADRRGWEEDQIPRQGACMGCRHYAQQDMKVTRELFGPWL